MYILTKSIVYDELLIVFHKPFTIGLNRVSVSRFYTNRRNGCDSTKYSILQRGIWSFQLSYVDIRHALYIKTQWSNPVVIWNIFSSSF